MISIGVSTFPDRHFCAGINTHTIKVSDHRALVAFQGDSVDLEGCFGVEDWGIHTFALTLVSKEASEVGGNPFLAVAPEFMCKR